MAPKMTPGGSKMASQEIKMASQAVKIGLTRGQNLQNLKKVDPGRPGSTKEEKKVGLVKDGHPLLQIFS